MMNAHGADNLLFLFIFVAALAGVVILLDWLSEVIGRRD